MLPLCSFPLLRVPVKSQQHSPLPYRVNTERIIIKDILLLFFLLLLLLLLPATVTRTRPLVHVAGPETKRIIFSFMPSGFTSMPRSSAIQRPSLNLTFVFPRIASIIATDNQQDVTVLFYYC